MAKSETSDEPRTSVHPTLAAAIKQEQTTTPDSVRIIANLDGVEQWSLNEHIDHRGRLVEIVNRSWPQWNVAVEHCYSVSYRPGYRSDWGLHKITTDRYALVTGELIVHLYDTREDSPTFEQTQKVTLSTRGSRCLLIPPGIWHSVGNPGETDVTLLNFKTPAFEHTDPDKYTVAYDNPIFPRM